MKLDVTAGLVGTLCVMVGACTTGPPPAQPIDNETPFTATMTGADVFSGAGAGGVDTTATGSATFGLSEDQTVLSYSVTVDGLQSEIIGAFLRMGSPGTNGPVVFDFTEAFTPGVTMVGGTWSIDAAIVQDLLAGDLYVEISTNANPNGEIRGQIGPV
ncbi:MAG: CHRD domain-containing protein [Phycisphaerae bacterium]